MRRSKIGEGSIYREGATGRWRAAFTIGTDGRGRQIRRTVSAKTEREVIAKRNELLLELLQGDKSPERMRVETWAETWLGEIAINRLHPLVWQDTRGKIRKYVVPVLGDYLLGDVGAEEIRELHRYVRGAGVSERTVQIVHSVASTMMRDAVREGLIPMNPCDRVDRPRARSGDRSALSAYHAKAVLIKAAAECDPLTSLWASALMLGARRGELIGLERDRVHLDAGVVDLSWQLQTLPWAHGSGCGCGEGVKPFRCPARRHAVTPDFEFRECHGSRVFTRPKTTAGVRAVPLPEPLRLILAQHMDATTGGLHNLVWTTGAGLPLAEKKVTAGWREALRRVGAPALDFHSARHTTVSLLLEAGVSPEVIAQIVGHSSYLSTRTYMHIPQAMTTRAMQQLGQLLG